MFSELWKIKLTDWQRALVVAILAAPIGVIYDWATTEGFQINWRTVLKGAIAGGIGYILKNFLTGQNGNLLTNK